MTNKLQSYWIEISGISNIPNKTLEKVAGGLTSERDREIFQIFYTQFQKEKRDSKETGRSFDVYQALGATISRLQSTAVDKKVKSWFPELFQTSTITRLQSDLQKVGFTREKWNGLVSSLSRDDQNLLREFISVYDAPGSKKSMSDIIVDFSVKYLIGYEKLHSKIAGWLLPPAVQETRQVAKEVVKRAKVSAPKTEALRAEKSIIAKPSVPAEPVVLPVVVTPTPAVVPAAPAAPAVPAAAPPAQPQADTAPKAPTVAPSEDALAVEDTVNINSVQNLTTLAWKILEACKKPSAGRLRRNITTNLRHIRAAVSKTPTIAELGNVHLLLKALESPHLLRDTILVDNQGYSVARGLIKTVEHMATKNPELIEKHLALKDTLTAITSIDDGVCGKKGPLHHTAKALLAGWNQVKTAPHVSEPSVLDPAHRSQGVSTAYSLGATRPGKDEKRGMSTYRLHKPSIKPR